MVLLHSINNKIQKPFILNVAGIIVLLTAEQQLQAQHTIPNKYSLTIVTNPAVLKKSISLYPDNAMLNLKEVIPGIEIDLAYASSHNFMGKKLYHNATTTYLRKPAAIALLQVQKKLNEKGYGLKIWDAYRPYSVTVKMWEHVLDERYAANPNLGSGHNRGTSVDLTIIDLSTHKELNMGTGFDNFTDTAHITFRNLPAEVRQNRLLLRTIMNENGFKVLETEWWHFYLPDAKKYDLLDLSFKQLKKLNKGYSN